jgi:hypothetical protein
MTIVFDFRPARPFAYTFADFARQESRLMTPPSTSQHHKIVGMVFDDKLQWRKHVEHVKTRTIKQLNLLKCLSGLQLGADQDILFKIHQTLILSVIEYGTKAYGSTRKSILEKLNSTYHQGLRIALGA